ncbi:MAG: FAD-dependent oxidoreductase [Promethearchaeota archaeon]
MTALKGNVLVLGGGIAGMQSSLDLAEAGFKVYLVEEGTAIGGIMAQLDKTFPTNDCSMCIMSPKLVETGRHPNITILTSCDLEKMEGEAGNFTVTFKQRSSFIINENCTGCGSCAEFCPVEVPNEYNAGIGTRKATFLRYPQAIPKKFTIDPDACIGCGLCYQICKANAVEYKLEDHYIDLNVGSIIIATGSDTYDPSVLTNYGYGTSPNILTSIEFERVLSASGPMMGHVLRPSDGTAPKTVAFIQCVGSRDRKHNREFCSAACCMYAMKESIIAREHNHDLDITIFYMDIRAYGKGFEEYYNRAQDSGIRFIRSRPGSARVTGDEQVEIVYEDRKGDLKTETFDMLVLSIGFDLKGKTKLFEEKLGVELNQYGFIQTSNLRPLETNVPGIFTCGVVKGPKDIPDTVAEASGAASKASLLVHEDRGKLIEKVELPEERDVLKEEPRVGVFVCHCGINIGSVVDVPEVVEYAKKLPNVVHVERNLYTCSQDTQEAMKEVIREKGINRVVVASCTPRTHEPLFQNTIREVGLNKYLFQLADIREQDSWVHMAHPREATEKAKGLVTSMVAKTSLLNPIEDLKMAVIQKAMVIGGGIAGITAALGFANQGFPTYLVEKTGELGGVMRRIQYLETGEDPQEFLRQKIEEVQNNENVTILFNSEVKGLDGFLGNYSVEVETSAEGEKTIEVGAIVVATGAREYKPTNTFLYGQHPNVVTELELEDKIKNDELKGNSFVFVQCVGSRNEVHPWCSRVCCTEAVKNAVHVKKLIPDATIYVLYRDIRTYGFKEDVYREARDLGIIFINYEVSQTPEVFQDDGKLKVRTYDSIIDRDLILDADYVVLSVAIEPNENAGLADILKVPLTQDGFYLEAHMKLRPVDFASDGLFLCGLAHGPKFISETIAQAEGAVARALTILSKSEIELEGIASIVDEDKCIACGMCVNVCPFDAIHLNYEKSCAEVSPVKCHGCGLCTGECPVGAIELGHYLDRQFYAQIEAIFEEKVFEEEN